MVEMGEVYREVYEVDTRRGVANLKAQNRELGESEKLLNRGASAAGRYERATGRAARGAARAPRPMQPGRGFWTGTLAGQVAARGLGGGPMGMFASAAGTAGGPVLAGMLGAGLAGLGVGVGAGVARLAYGAEAFAAEGKPLEAAYINAREAEKTRAQNRTWYGRMLGKVPVLSNVGMAITEAASGREAERMTRAEMVRYLADERLAEKERAREAREIDREISALVRAQVRGTQRREFSGGSSWGP